MDNTNRENIARLLVFQNRAPGGFFELLFSIVCPFGTRLENHLITHDPPTRRWVSGDSGL